MIERTLVILKPDAVARGFVGEILSRFEKAGLKIVGMKMSSPADEHFFEHYENIGKMISRRGKDVFDGALEYMKLGPVVAVVLEGVSAPATVRKMVGATNPEEALPGTIRADYSHQSFAYKNPKSVMNVIHASGDVEEANLEIALWFKPDELFDYKTAHETYTL